MNSRTIPDDVLLVQTSHDDWERKELILLKADGEVTSFIKRIVRLQGSELKQSGNCSGPTSYPDGKGRQFT